MGSSAFRSLYCTHEAIIYLHLNFRDERFWYFLHSSHVQCRRHSWCHLSICCNNRLRWSSLFSAFESTHYGNLWPTVQHTGCTETKKIIKFRCRKKGRIIDTLLRFQSGTFYDEWIYLRRPLFNIKTLSVGLKYSSLFIIRTAGDQKIMFELYGISS